MLNPAAIFTVLSGRQRPAGTPTALLAPLEDPRHARWQSLVLDGQLFEGVKAARDLGLDLPQAMDLVNEFRAERGLLPRPRRWWQRIFQ